MHSVSKHVRRGVVIYLFLVSERKADNKESFSVGKKHFVMF